MSSEKALSNKYEQSAGTLNILKKALAHTYSEFCSSKTIVFEALDVQMEATANSFQNISQMNDNPTIDFTNISIIKGSSCNVTSVGCAKTLSWSLHKT